MRDRNVAKQIAEGQRRLKDVMELSCNELSELMDIAEKDGRSLHGIYDAVTAAFYFGVAVGIRQTLK